MVLAACLACVAGGAVFSGRLPRAARTLQPVDVAVAAFVALNLAAWGLSRDRHQSLYGERLQYQGLLTLLLYVGFFYVARLSLADAARARLLTLAIAGGATVVAAYAIAQKTGVDPIWNGSLPAGRVFSSIGQPNALAAYLVLALPLAASLGAGRAPARYAAVLAVGVIAAALFFTVSRGGYIAAAVALAVLGVGARRRLSLSARTVRLAAAIVAGVLAIALVVHPTRAVFTDSWHRVEAGFSSGGDDSVQFHLDAWHVAVRIAADHPLLGTGPETFPEIFPGYSHRVLSSRRAGALDAFRVESPHNVYLATAAGSGIPALVAYLAIIVCFFVALARAARRATDSAGPPLILVAFGAAAVGHLVADAFITADLTGTWLFWVLMGCGFAVTSDDRRSAA